MTSRGLAAEGIWFGYGRFRRHPVFTDFDWRVTPGETTLLLGPNGAGKSTLLKLLCGFEKPVAGRVTIGGDASTRALFAEVGWMPQRIDPVRGLTVLEQVEYAAWVGGATERDARRWAREAVAAVDLDDKRDDRADRISGGQLRRVGLAQALARRSSVLLLDEPTAGLDPAQTLNFRGVLSSLECPGGVVISTHQVHDLADDVARVVVLADGSIRFDGSASDFLALGGSGSDPASLARVFSEMVGGGRH